MLQNSLVIQLEKKPSNHFPWGESKPGETTLRRGQMSTNCKGDYIWNYDIDFSCLKNKAWVSLVCDQYCREATLSVFIGL